MSGCTMCKDCVHNVIGVCMRTRMTVGIFDNACSKAHAPAYAGTVCSGCRGVCNPEECDYDAASGSCARLKQLTKSAGENGNS